MAWSGESFLVVWRASGFDTSSRIMGTLVSEDGSVVRRFTIDSDGSLYEGPRVAYDGTYYQVVWRESGAARFARVTTAGSVLGPSRPVCPAGGWQQHVTIASTDGASLVAFGDSRQPEGIGLYANIIYPDGTLLDTTPFRIRSASPPPAPAVAHDGLNFVVAWAERGDAAELRAARVTVGGAVLDSGGVPVGQVPLVRDLGAGAWKDTTLLVCVTSQDSHFQVRGWRLDNDLNVLDSVGLIVSSLYVGDEVWNPYGVSVARARGDFLITWSHLLGPNCWLGRDVVGRRVARDGTVLDTTEVPLSFAASYQWRPDIASDGENFLAVWSDFDRGRGPSPRLRMSRFASQGTLLDSSFPLSSPPVWASGVAYGADCFLACWARMLSPDSEQVEFRRIDRHGVPLDTAPRVLSCGYGDVWTVDAAYGDSLFLVVWNREWNLRFDVFGMRISPDGTVLDSAPVRLEVGNTISASPQVASDGQKFLVTRYGQRRIRAVRVSSACVVLDTAEIIIKQVSSMGVDRRPQVAFGAGVYLVTDHYGQQAWRISPKGEVLDTALFLPEGLSIEQLPVAFDGVNFQLVACSDLLWPEYEMRGVRISPNGQVLDAEPIPLVVVDPVFPRLGHRSSGLAVNSSGRLGMVFCTEEFEPYMTSRIRGCTFPRLAGAIAETREPERTGPLPEPT
ncbi:MAG: hypothetical protein JSU73_00135, partial [candidate division WOR-3 bacterium]